MHDTIQEVTVRQEVRNEPRVAPERPILTAVARWWGRPVLRYHVLLAILHFLKDLPPFVDHLEYLGVRRDDALFVPVVYSCREYVLRLMEAKGWHVNAAPTFGQPFDMAVREGLRWALQRARATGKPVLIVEDGGYAVPLLLEEFPDSLSLVAGAVEQTANGCWRNREAVRRFELAKDNSGFPQHYHLSTNEWVVVHDAEFTLLVAGRSIYVQSLGKTAIVYIPKGVCHTVQSAASPLRYAVVKDGPDDFRPCPRGHRAPGKSVAA